MKPFLSFLNLSFIPKSADFGLLVLRGALGVGMLVLHGWSKWTNFSKTATGFFDPLHIGSKNSLGLVVFAEVVCSALLVIGFCTRFAALVLAINVGVALFMVHKGVLSGAAGGEKAALYLAGYVTIFLAGAGKFSADGAGGAPAGK